MVSGQPAEGEEQRTCGRQVGPLQVLDHQHSSRRTALHVRDEREHFDSDSERIGRRRRTVGEQLQAVQGPR